MATTNRQDAERPALLYRYRSLGGEFGRQTAEDIIINSRMYWSSPAAFNDPMDCRPHFVFSNSIRDQIVWARNVIRRNYPDAGRNERKGLERRLLEGGPVQHRQLAMDGFSQWMNESAVCCFSTIPDSLLMWSHYADHHRGIVFVFEQQVEPQPFFAFPVSYSERRPSVDITRIAADGPTAIRNAILTKAAVWSYEAEMRMIEYRVAPGVRRFPQHALRGVIFGARISDVDRNWVNSLIAASGRKIQCSTARLSETQFILEVTND